MGEHHAARRAEVPQDARRAGADRGGGAGAPRGEHTPVLLARCLELLAPALRGDGAPTYVDATVGLGGHADAVLAGFPAVRLIGLDRDPRALELSGRRLARYGDRVALTKARYDELPAVLQRLSVSSVDGALFDLGVSSMQVDEPARGFSYAHDAPLDMRMDPTTPTTAEEIVNTYPPAALARILRQYGEE